MFAQPVWAQPETEKVPDKEQPAQNTHVHVDTHKLTN